jgi:carbon-monoxide dehydrogenase medium subunit
MEYLTPATVDEALATLNKYSKDAVIIAGGVFFTPHKEELFSEAEILINISKLGLDYIKVDEEGLKLGATTSLTSVMTSDITSKGVLRVLFEAISSIPIQRIRDMGTVGGDICMSAEADLPTALIALDSKLVIANSTKIRILPLEEFYLGYLSNALGPEEMVTEIQIPNFPSKTGAAFHKIERGTVDLPIVNAAARITLSHDYKCSDVKIVLGCVAFPPVIADNAEELLMGNKLDEKIIARAAEIAIDIECTTDIRASGELRKRWGRIAVEQALSKAHAQAKGDK